jgi:hypothetical protein
MKKTLRIAYPISRLAHFRPPCYRQELKEFASSLIYSVKRSVQLGLYFVSVRRRPPCCESVRREGCDL